MNACFDAGGILLGTKDPHHRPEAMTSSLLERMWAGRLYRVQDSTTTTTHAACNIPLVLILEARNKYLVNW